MATPSYATAAASKIPRHEGNGAGRAKPVNPRNSAHPNNLNNNSGKSNNNDNNNNNNNNNNSRTKSNNSNSLAKQLEELSQPPPQSMALMATLHLLKPLDTNKNPGSGALGNSDDVYLMRRSYLQNWLIWAYHQKVTKRESSRVEAAVRLAADRLGLTVGLDMPFSDPGPIDSSGLSMVGEGHPLLLRPNVVIVPEEFNNTSKLRPSLMMRRVKSLPDAEDKKQEDGDTPYNKDENLDVQGSQVLCCAVPQKFYEILRAVHGVTCDDGFSVSFQPFPNETDALLHHHVHEMGSNLGVSSLSTIGGSKQNQQQEQQRLQRQAEQLEQPRPIEFRRRIIYKTEPSFKYSMGREESPASPMTKLLKEQEKFEAPRMLPVVEVYPLKLNYTIVDENTQKVSEKGFVLVSRRTLVHDALQGLMKVAAPNTSSTCKRVWSKRDTHATKSGDGYEVVDLESLDGKLLPKEDPNKKSSAPASRPTISPMVMQEWTRAHRPTNQNQHKNNHQYHHHQHIPSHQVEVDEIVKELDVLVEIKRSSAHWPRKPLELSERIQVGDFVDAQDPAGKWYEALVREVNEDTVKVHYFGWASKWDGTLRRRPNTEISGSLARILPPAPLWTHTPRWRERLLEGKIVEVRDASSRADRPKWYKGIVRVVGSKNGKVQNLTGGAELEFYEQPVDKDKNGGAVVKKPLLLLDRTQQIMVEVEQERKNNVGLSVASISISENADLTIDTDMDALKPHPPALRWVNLYGEEICEAGTHMKIKNDDSGVVTLRYEYDQGRKPVEVMKSWNGMYGQGFMKESLLGTPPAPGSVGMHNLGNSCYLNSVVQCLNHIEPLTQFFLQGNYVKDLNTKNPLGSGGRVSTAYSSLLKEIWSGKYSALAPRMLKQTVASFAPQFNNSFQHDSQEFCQFLMDGVHEDCNRVKSKPYVEELEGFGMEDSKAAIETWRKHLLRHDSVIVDYCQGMHRSHLTCPSCGRESIKFDVYSTISLPLAQDKDTKTIELEDCIEKFMEGEQLDELNAWYCPNCKKHVCALKMIALWTVPDVLILHLKRFQFDHCSVRNDIVRSKIDSTVKFPIDSLDLRKHILGPIDENAPPVYQLFGVSEHTGSTANSGHYTATVRNSKDGRWYRYNDAHVGETTGDAAITGGAYLLFYQRTKGSAKWAGLENAMKERDIDPYGGLETDQDGFKAVKSKKKKN